MRGIGASAQVYWGKVKADWEGSVLASNTKVTFEGTCSALGPHTLNQAVLTGLEPSTTYFYKFGDVRTPVCGIQARKHARGGHVAVSRRSLSARLHVCGV